ncbi:ABC transporter ATP-binding protein [Rivularia sp. UHCC 0363]|uniref:ABC transporter ATP-binding protein n=1 Tax=Rivularia sp. UHCC 0363 TaxID=3110244 RepID=UPI002B1F4E60|nr:ABC transporter ATP-binding protein [Rivularia sp. UHCC 0363]MEA5593445.1 ABC transporter ATP-binding protein [Rivularia sp. UHCC 0363]
MTKIVIKLRSILPQLPYLTKAIKLVWQSAGYWIIIWAVLLIFQGILPAIQIYLIKTAINSFVAVVKTDIRSTNLNAALIYIAILVGLLLFAGAIANFSIWVRSQIAELTQDYASSAIHRQAISLDLAFFESPDYYNHLHRACVEGKNQPVILLENLGELGVSTLTLLSVAVVLLPLGIWLPLGLLLSSFPPFLAMYKSNQLENQWRLHNTVTQRYLDYYEQILTESEFAAEVRLFGLGDRFHNDYQKLRQKLRTEKMRLMRSRSLAQFFASFLSLVILGIALSWMVSQMAQDKLSLGDLALLLQSLWLAQGLLQRLLRTCGKTYQNLLLLQDLFAFLSLQPLLTSKDAECKRHQNVNLGLSKGICFEGVSFAYPGSQHLALDDFTLTIPVGQIVAIVGENGAGKSTLSKLLCRFYDPKAGKVTIDGVDIRDIPIAELRQFFSVMFQFPARYHDTVTNNMIMGVLNTNPTPTQIDTVAQATGADITIRQLPAGYDTLLGKRFGGTELSGGQWQRLALARTWLRSAPIVILDEPTSAMDTWAENNWLGSLRQLAQGKTVVIITHRLTTAQHADTIHVMAQGKIVESGTHQQLLAKGGNYTQSWQLQLEAEKALS